MLGPPHTHVGPASAKRGRVRVRSGLNSAHLGRARSKLRLKLGRCCTTSARIGANSTKLKISNGFRAELDGRCMDIQVFRDPSRPPSVMPTVRPDRPGDRPGRRVGGLPRPRQRGAQRGDRLGDRSAPAPRGGAAVRRRRALAGGGAALPRGRAARCGSQDLGVFSRSSLHKSRSLRPLGRISEVRPTTAAPQTRPGPGPH